jgi:hypothetical protein
MLVGHKLCRHPHDYMWGSRPCHPRAQPGGNSTCCQLRPTQCRRHPCLMKVPPHDERTSRSIDR